MAFQGKKEDFVWREMKKKPVKLRIERADGFCHVVIPEISAWNAGFLKF